MVRKGGFEPPRLSAPPPQDGVSASSTTSALCKSLVINSVASSCADGIPICAGISPPYCRHTLVSPLQVRHCRKTTGGSSVPWVYATDNVTVSGDILQRRWRGVLSRLGQKSVMQSSQCGSAATPLSCGNELSSLLAPFQKICTPMHTSRNAVSFRITLVPVAPILLASRSE